ncbi:hypothetical protein ZWY2020_038307 [Hordeum vulgare]|nr:hypothetical protein ZWY2020_038307 [Hordeum vulgare]
MGAGGKAGKARRAARVSLWVARASTTVLLWTCVVVLLAAAFGEHLAPSVLGLGGVWSGCLAQTLVIVQRPLLLPADRERVAATATAAAVALPLPPKRIYKNNGYLMVSCNGGLNQMRAAICDMVTVARYLNVTLIVPELDKTSFWADPSEFRDIFDVDYFIASLRDEVRILKELPPRLKKRVEQGYLRSMPPVSWSDISYYNNQIYPEIEELGRRVVQILRQNGPFVVLHLRYEMDMLAFSGCTHGCSNEEAEELTRMRYCIPSNFSRCFDLLLTNELRLELEDRLPMVERESDRLQCEEERALSINTEEIAMVLKALDIDRNYQIYIAAGEIYGGQRRMAALTSAYPNVVRKETLLPSGLRFFQNHSSQMAALDYMVSLESDVFIPTYDGNMAKVVEGHEKTVLLDRKLVVELVDEYKSGTLSWSISPPL